MSTLELQRFESVPAGDGLVLFRLAGRWPHHGDAADASATLMVRTGGDTHEFDALPEPGLIGDGGARNAAFAAPEELRAEATGFALAVDDLVFDLPECDSHSAAAAKRPEPDRPYPYGHRRRSSAAPRVRLPAVRAPSLRLPRLRMPALRAPVAARALPRPRLDAWDMDELRVMATGCALGAACATAILIEIIP